MVNAVSLDKISELATCENGTVVRDLHSLHESSTRVAVATPMDAMVPVLTCLARFHLHQYVATRRTDE